MLIGREKEQALLNDLLHSNQSEFVALYGRRRVGKTYLVRETFNYQFAFQHTGILDAPMSEQLGEFRESLYAAGLPKCPKPKTWGEAFRLLQRLLASLPEGKKVVFIDELPWMDTPKSNFIRALDHFWNAWATTRKDIILIVCGSATSWIIDNIVMNYGGLHDRVTRQIQLRPFTLKECEQYSQQNKLDFTRRQILEAYMVMGGIPYYWSFLRPGLSIAQNIDRMFFEEDGEMVHEYDALYASLFRRPKTHIAIVNALATKKGGLQREEILDITKISDNETFSKALKELEQCGFIRKYTMIGNKKKGTLYQLMDNYTLFWFKFIGENTRGESHFWTSNLDTGVYDNWVGLAFERVCLQHLEQIKKAMGLTVVISTAHSWSWKAPKDSNEEGVQIDLLIDRNDDTINLCEMKYSKSPYPLSSEDLSKMEYRKTVFKRETGTEKRIMLSLITTFGLTNNANAADIPVKLTMEDLFQ
jgi:AAA+ ATPase superfamily predicted ATPase